MPAYPDGMPPPPRRTLPTVGEDPAKVQQHFASFAQGHAHLPLYHRICLRPRGTTRSPRCCSPPDRARRDQCSSSPPLHDLVLRHPDLPAARWYASVVGRHGLPSGDPWPEVRATLLDHRDELTDVIATRPPRPTRSTAPSTSPPGSPGPQRTSRTLPALVELGASAGLLLALDRYDTALTRDDAPAPAMATLPRRCAAGARTAPRSPGPGHPADRLPGRADLDPVDLHDAEAVRWLEARLWPDVAGRVERFTAAVDRPVRPSPGRPR